LARPCGGGAAGEAVAEAQLAALGVEDVVAVGGAAAAEVGDGRPADPHRGEGAGGVALGGDGVVAEGLAQGWRAAARWSVELADLDALAGEHGGGDEGEGLAGGAGAGAEDLAAAGGGVAGPGGVGDIAATAGGHAEAAGQPAQAQPHACPIEQGRSGRVGRADEL
jgi:hypothetical protein